MPQSCQSCAGVFALHAGPALDGSRQPAPFDPNAERIKVKYADVGTYRFGIVEAQGVAEGMVDPITGLIPMDQSGVAYPDILSIAVWRKIDLVELAVGLLVPTPIALFAIWGAMGGKAWLAWVALAFVLLAAWMLYRAIGVRANYARIVGRHRTIKVRFDRPLRRRRRFHDELLRRAGVPASQMP